MPVDCLHSSLTTQVLANWRTVRDCLEGEAQIKARGVVYLPKLHEQEPEEYNGYLNRAVFFNATGRTHEAMVGFIFRKPPTIEATPLKDFLEDCDLAGTPFVGYARKVVTDVAAVGRAGSVVDWSEADGRPYVAFYPAEDIINWRYERLGGCMRLTLLVVRECVERPSADPYLPEVVEQFRVYRLVPGAPGNDTTPASPGIVQAEVWQRVKAVHRTDGVKEAVPGNAAADTTLKQVDGRTMTRRSQALPDIPFVFHGAEENSPKVGRAPLADISHINVAHFRNSADLENGRHVCGIPTPYAVGFASDGKYYLGSSHVWVSDNPDAKAGYIEFAGQGLDSLKDGLEEKQGQMASLGARLIEPQKKDAEAYETVQLRAAAETSALAKIGILGSESLTSVLDWAAWWTSPTADHPDSLKEEINIALNKDFSSSAMDPAMLTALVGSWQQNAISRDTLFHNLQRGELYAEGRTMEEELESIETAPPAAPPIAVDPNKIDPETGKPYVPPTPPPGAGGPKKTPAKKAAAKPPAR